MGDAALKSHLSPEEYLTFERAAAERHEYADGEIFAMSGGTYEHSKIAGNLIRELGGMLSGRGCDVLTSDMRIHIPSTRRYVYADVAVVCEKPLFADDKRDTLLNPALLVEVLSDSSEAYDRGDKFANYRSLASLRSYLLASQREPLIEVFSRQSDDSWVLRVYGPGERAGLPEHGLFIEVDRIYQGVFEAPAGAAGASA